MYSPTPLRGDGFIFLERELICQSLLNAFLSVLGILGYEQTVSQSWVSAQVNPRKEKWLRQFVISHSNYSLRSPIQHHTISYKQCDSIFTKWGLVFHFSRAAKFDIVKITLWPQVGESKLEAWLAQWSLSSSHSKFIFHSLLSQLSGK